MSEALVTGRKYGFLYTSGILNYRDLHNQKDEKGAPSITLPPTGREVQKGGGEKGRGRGGRALDSAGVSRGFLRKERVGTHVPWCIGGATSGRDLGGGGEIRDGPQGGEPSSVSGVTDQDRGRDYE